MEHTPGDSPFDLTEDMIPDEVSIGTDEDVKIPDEVDDWVDETTGFERMASVASVTTEPQTAKWFSDQAVVAEKTARAYLTTFAKLGVVASFTSSGVTRYHADEAWLHYREVQQHVEEHSEEELTEHVADLRESIEAVKDEFEVETPDELRRKAADDDTPVEEIRELKKTASDLEAMQDQLAVVQDAIRQFDRFQIQGRSSV